MERAAVPWFGMKAYGVHINGFVRDEKTGEVSHLWVARRAKNKSTFPGMLDHIVAGGQPFGISPFENVIKECYEEANIPEVRNVIFMCITLPYLIFKINNSSCIPCCIE